MLILWKWILVLLSSELLFSKYSLLALPTKDRVDFPVTLMSGSAMCFALSSRMFMTMIQAEALTMLYASTGIVLQWQTIKKAYKSLLSPFPPGPKANTCGTELSPKCSLNLTPVNVQPNVEPLAGLSLRQLSDDHPGGQWMRAQVRVILSHEFGANLLYSISVAMVGQHRTQYQK